MNEEYLRIFAAPRDPRILENRKDLPSHVLNAFGLQEPKVVICSPLASCEPKNCFVNVERQVSSMGGKVEVGWMFWEIKDQCYYTEAHSIWVGPQGTHVDITPHSMFQPRKILFSPDSKVAAKRGYTAGHRHIATKDKRVRMIEEYMLEVDRIMERYFKGVFGTEMEIPTSEFKEAAEKIGLPTDVAKLIVQFAHRSK